MKLWPKEFLFKLGASFIFYTCYLFTFFTLGDHFILGKEQTSEELLSTLVMAMVLSIVIILIEKKKWKEKLNRIRTGADQTLPS